MNIYLLGKYIPQKTPIYKALQYFKGIGKKSSIDICKKIGLQKQFKVEQLNKQQIALITNILNENYLVENQLVEKITKDIDYHKKIKSYKGWRHLLQLPVRGQRTHTNASTRKRVKF